MKEKEKDKNTHNFRDDLFAQIEGRLSALGTKLTNHNITSPNMSKKQTFKQARRSA